jgi:hypothetical protein
MAPLKILRDFGERGEIEWTAANKLRLEGRPLFIFAFRQKEIQLCILIQLTSLFIQTAVYIHSPQMASSLWRPEY